MVAAATRSTAVTAGTDADDPLFVVAAEGVDLRADPATAGPERPLTALVLAPVAALASAFRGPERSPADTAPPELRTVAAGPAALATPEGPTSERGTPELETWLRPAEFLPSTEPLPDDFVADGEPCSDDPTDEDDESESSAAATAPLDNPTPTPSATAIAPTRPTYCP
ncbi:hypothetical protein ORI20_23045 [Mycobacterium sp. CVI_P3]|uniref:Uncharacterized protein n=1 Tax=Mycobacterium pinniadriaticum TaxID=2994102 RepID=A0ABT3SJB9_9MYCO|nr:hypothetical protein [Mycobacterium pinniadriaticum]MCX2933152.1 hypothetical protein [Mycobacterium pinniadriaticum]MCX2939548.1 hypothetical protein [Mycobacterium pinniadriaticum]